MGASRKRFVYFSETRGATTHVMAGFDTAIRQRYRDFLQTAASVFASGMKRERFNKIADPYHLAVALDSLTTAFLFLWLESPERNPYPKDPDVILSILVKGLVGP